LAVLRSDTRYNKSMPGNILSQIASPSAARKWLLGLSIVALILITVVGVIMGYRDQIQETENVRAAQAIMDAKVTAQEQFYLGTRAIKAQRYSDAKTLFEYVILVDPNFPGAVEGLTQALIGIYTEPSPTPTPDPQATPSITPTPEIPNEVELLYQAQDLVKNRVWSLAIETLQTLRSFHPQYQLAEVDDLLFTSLYNRGMAYFKEGDLAGGIYDLERAARFGALDEDAKIKQEWASFYLVGVSHWGLDWGKTVYYFELLTDEAPDFQDASGMTAQERYREAAQHFAELLVNREEWCEAERYFRITLEYGGGNDLGNLLDNATKMCDETKDSEED